MGFIFEEGCYLRDIWNWLDFTVVITGALTSLPGMSNWSVLRTFRIFRPLRSLSASPSMRMLVNTFFQSLGQLSNIFALIIFFYAIFAVMGSSMWAGVVHNRCWLTSDPVDGLWQVAQHEPEGRICGGSHQCDDGEFCRNFYDVYDTCENHCGLTEDDLEQGEKVNFGITHFDNIASAFLTIFQCTTLEGWTKIMYIMADGFNGVLAAMYFCLLIIMCSYFVMNLTIAVMLENLSKDESVLEKYESHLEGIEKIYRLNHDDELSSSGVLKKAASLKIKTNSLQRRIKRLSLCTNPVNLESQRKSCKNRCRTLLLYFFLKLFQSNIPEVLMN